MSAARKKSVRALFEAIESRVHLDATYVSLSAGAFAQDWSDTSLISVDDDWSGVIGIVGYRGDGLASDGDNPQLVVTDSTVVDVNEGRASGTFTTGGVSEFELTDPVVGIKGSATADAPYLQFHLNTSGMKDVVVAYNLRDIEAGTPNTVQQVALQYRVGETGNWIDLPAGYVADASDGPNLVKVTPVSVMLPVAAEDQPKVQVRVITADAPSTDEYIGVDDINISATSNIVVPSLVLNEVNVNPPTASDALFEYVELKGTPSELINNVYVLAINGDSFNSGTVSASLGLNGVSFGTNGLMMIKAGSGGFASESSETTVVFDTSLGGGQLLNGSLSVLVVFSPTNIADGTDLDQDGNGTLESLPGGAQIIDSIGWRLAGSSGDVVYGTELVASEVVTPDAASRIAGNTAPNSASAWFYGDLNNTSGNSSKGYLASAGFNLPTADARITPGAGNFTAPGAPNVQDITFDIDARPMSVTVDFDKDVSASLVLSDGSDSSFILTHRDTSTNVPAANITKTLTDSDGVILKFPGYTGPNGFGTLPDGNYRLTVVAANVKDASNTPMAADEPYDFFVLNGDATGDRKVDTRDFNVLVHNFGSGAQVFSRGDFNYNSVVDSTDFNLFVGQYGKSLAALPAPVPAAVAGGALFDDTPDQPEEFLLH